MSIENAFRHANLIMRRIGLMLASLATCVLLYCNRTYDSGDFSQARKGMVEKQIVARGIEDERVIRAMLKVPRHLFVPEEYRRYAYSDSPLPVGCNQTISQPYIVALMTEELRLQQSDKVLEIGTGSGYQAAVLAEIAGEVYTIEIIEELARTAEARLQEIGYQNVRVKAGDGYLGWPEYAPFDKIIVTCAPTDIPRPLVEQLREGGIMVIPVGSVGLQYLYRVRKRDGRIETERIIPVSFVPLTGPHGEAR